MSDAWQHEESFAITNARMLDDDVLCDVTLLAGKDKQEVRCHRFMLASRSPVFHTMFCGSLPEGSVVEIPDVEADVMRAAIRYLRIILLKLYNEHLTTLLKEKKHM